MMVMKDASTFKEQHTAVYAFGSNGSGQLGIGYTDDVSTPSPIVGMRTLATPGLRQIACGGNHTVFLFNERDLASTGENGDGRLFITMKRQTKHLAHMPLPLDESGGGEFKLRHVAATWSATIALCDRGDIWTCGTGLSGELGLGVRTDVARNPNPIPDFPPPETTVVKLAASMAHVVAVLSNGEVWGWGKGRKGQLGEPHENFWKPKKIDNISFFVVDAVCGKDFTCVVGHSSTGDLMMLGPTGNDRFGVIKDAPESIPDWKQVGASWGSVYVLLKSGQLIAWGRNDRGQLPPTGLPTLQSFATGSEHCLGLTYAGKVLAWGWGEHGNCGQQTDNAGDVKGRWNIIETLAPASAVFAGCATSFIVIDEQNHWTEDRARIPTSKHDSLMD